jgi:hypothetical protein
MNRKKAKALALRSTQRHIGREKKEKITELNPEALFLGNSEDDDMYDAALIGSVQMPCKGFVACYDYDKCVECLVNGQGMTHEDALKWMEVSAYVGEHGPVLFSPVVLDED